MRHFKDDIISEKRYSDTVSASCNAFMFFFGVIMIRINCYILSSIITTLEVLEASLSLFVPSGPMYDLHKVK